MNSTNETHAVVEYHPNKKTKVFYICRNGSPDGLYMEYHDNGNVKKEVNYVGGVKHGEYKVYHRNGNICAEGNFVNGKREGKHTHYFVTGGKYREIQYENDAITRGYREWTHTHEKIREYDDLCLRGVQSKL